VVSSLRRNARQMASALGLAGARSARTRPAVGRRFLEELRPVFTAYLEVHEALARDRAADAAAAAAKALTALERMEEVPGDKGDQSAWSEQAAALRKAFGSVAAAKDLVAAREAFVSASEQLFATARRFGPPPGLDLFGMNCPMAFDNRGARWLQSDRQVRNPYFGAAMPRCGEVVEVIEAPPADPADNGHNGHQRP